jgi:hypothetical protein
MGVGSGGDYAQEKRWYTDKTTDVDYAASAVGNAITPKTSSHQLFIQKITYSPTTVAAVAISVDDDGSGGPVALIPASQATPITIDFGPKGLGLTVGANLDIAAAAGTAGRFHIEAYEKLGAVIAYDSGAANQ